MADGISTTCGQIRWRGGEFTQDQILEQIATAGYDGAPAFAPSLDDVDSVRQKFDVAGLRPTPACFGAEFWDESQADEIVARAAHTAATAKAFGLTDVYVAANLTPERRAFSGRVQASDGLSADAKDVFARTLERLGAATLNHAVKASIHNHEGVASGKQSPSKAKTRWKPPSRLT